MKKSPKKPPIKPADSVKSFKKNEPIILDTHSQDADRQRRVRHLVSKKQ